MQTDAEKHQGSREVSTKSPQSKTEPNQDSNLGYKGTAILKVTLNAVTCFVIFAAVLLDSCLATRSILYFFVEEVEKNLILFVIHSQIKFSGLVMSMKL